MTTLGSNQQERTGLLPRTVEVRQGKTRSTQHKLGDGAITGKERKRMEGKGTEEEEGSHKDGREGKIARRN